MEPINCSDTVNGLRGAREERGLSQEQLGELVGVTDGTISNWETGRATPGSPSRKILALVLGKNHATVDSWFQQREAIAS